MSYNKFNHNVNLTYFRSLGVGTSSAAARIGSMSAPYINWLVCISFYSSVLSVGDSCHMRKKKKKTLNYNVLTIRWSKENIRGPDVSRLEAKCDLDLKKGPSLYVAST